MPMLYFSSQDGICLNSGRPDVLRGAKARRVSETGRTPSRVSYGETYYPGGY